MIDLMIWGLDKLSQIFDFSSVIESEHKNWSGLNAKVICGRLSRVFVEQLLMNCIYE